MPSPSVRPAVVATALAALVASGLPAACAPSADDDTGPDVWRGDDDDPPLADLAIAVSPLGADALNPHGDGSGVVRLTASATGAVRYGFQVDDGAAVTSETGQVEVSVDREGTHAYTFTVTAHDDAGSAARAAATVEVYSSTAPFPTLVWADEFDVDGPVDPARWKPQDVPPVEGGWFNGEQQHYTGRLDNAYVSDGTLKIVAKKERYTAGGRTLDYTSARLNSRFAFTYGRVEVRARLPAEAGTWPAIWTLGANINEVGNPFGDRFGSVGWPACGEIDVMEQRGWDKQNTIAHFHWGDTRTGAYRNEGGELRVPTSTTAFHVYSLRWDAERLQVFVDDRLVHAMPNDDTRPYHHDHYLLLNVAMGGSLGGGVPADFDRAALEIDWVRVYQ